MVEARMARSSPIVKVNKATTYSERPDMNDESNYQILMQPFHYMKYYTRKGQLFLRRPTNEPRNIYSVPAFGHRERHLNGASAKQHVTLDIGLQVAGDKQYSH